ncbi:MAG: hypothetical protein PGN13_14525 [Patulibacter minatonensis]
MSQATNRSTLPEPRLVVVLAGAATVGTLTPTALERASMPNLAALAMGGRVGRLRAVPPHHPVDATSAHATLLGATLPDALDPAAVSAEAAGALVAPGERCTLVEVLDHVGDAAPALHVARALEVLRGQLADYRVAAVRRGNQLLLAGPGRPKMPVVDGLQLTAAPAGHLPSAPPLDPSTVAIAAAGSSLLGVARLLGATPVMVDGMRAGRHDPVPERLRSAALRALLGGAATIVVETTAPLIARRGLRDDPSRERAAAAVLSLLDRELLGPLRTAAAWRGAGFVVTSDIARASSGPPVRGDVPIVVAGGHGETTTARGARVGSDGTLLPPVYSERGQLGRAIVTSPFALPPVRDPLAPIRFARDPASGRTVPIEPAA